MNTLINNSRFSFDQLGKRYKQADNITIEQEVIENTNCYWFYEKGMSLENSIIIYLHGGCFVLGSINSHQTLVSHLSKELNTPILFVEYSLAPENPFPKAIEEIIQVYKYLLHKRNTNSIIIMGDSAGAGLAVSVISRLNNEKISMPGFLIMLSPWIDLNCQNNSLIKNKDCDPVLTQKALQNYTSMYVGNAKLSDANPIENNIDNFPPTLILVGSGEILLDDSKSLYNKIAGFQEKVKLTIYENQNHVWMLENIHSEESKRAINEIREFIST